MNLSFAVYHNDGQKQYTMGVGYSLIALVVQPHLKTILFLILW